MDSLDSIENEFYLLGKMLVEFISTEYRLAGILLLLHCTCWFVMLWMGYPRRRKNIHQQSMNGLAAVLLLQMLLIWMARPIHEALYAHQKALLSHRHQVKEESATMSTGGILDSLWSQYPLMLDSLWSQYPLIVHPENGYFGPNHHHQSHHHVNQHDDVSDGGGMLVSLLYAVPMLLCVCVGVCLLLWHVGQMLVHVKRMELKHGRRENQNASGGRGDLKAKQS